MIGANNIEENKAKSLIQFFGIFAVVFTSFAYLIGLAYYQGYMAAFGVSSDIFPKATADIYVDAYIAIGLMMIDLIKLIAKLVAVREFYFWLLALCFGMYLLFKFVHFFKSIKLSSKVNSYVLKVLAYVHYKNNDLSKAVAYISIPTYFIILLIYLIIFVSIFWWGFPFWADKKGEEAARNQIKAYLEKGCVIDKKSGWNNCLLLLDENDNALHEGLFIAKNDYELAMFKKEGAFLIKLKESYLIKKSR